MSYSEDSSGNVVLRMSREDWQRLLMMLGGLMTAEMLNPGKTPLPHDQMIEFVNRLNDGNPNYKPYHVPATTQLPEGRDPERVRSGDGS